jgi:hypothetical protein
MNRGELLSRNAPQVIQRRGRNLRRHGFTLKMH